MTRKIIYLLIIVNLNFICFSQNKTDKTNNDCYREKIKLNVKEKVFKDTVVTFRNYIKGCDDMRIMCNNSIIDKDIEKLIWESKNIQTYLEYQNNLGYFSIISYKTDNQKCTIVRYFLCERKSKVTVEMRRFKIENNEITEINFLPKNEDEFVSLSINQLSRVYSIGLHKYFSPNSFSDYTLGFFIDVDGNYLIELMNFPSFPINKDYYISVGKYEINNNIIYLTDSYTGCKMSFRLDSINLKPIKTYPFMSKLIYNEYDICGRLKKNDRIKETTVENLVSDFKTKNINTNPLAEGLYRFEYFSRNRFETKLNKDGKYEFCFKYLGDSQSFRKIDRSYFPELYLVISTGTWERKGNILVLWDTNLQHKFYGLIRKDGSIEFLFFRWVDDMIFKKIN